MKKDAEEQCSQRLFALLSVTSEGPDNIVVTKSYSEYCNAALSVVHELYTAQFQCSSPLFPLGNAKLIKFGQITKFFKMHVRVLSDNYFFVFPLVFCELVQYGFFGQVHQVL